jgi:hypothetical protein
MEDPMAIDKKLIDQLLSDYKKPEDIIGGKQTAPRADQSHSGASARGRDDRSSGLREARPAGHRTTSPRRGSICLHQQSISTLVWGSHRQSAATEPVREISAPSLPESCIVWLRWQQQ